MKDDIGSIAISICVLLVIMFSRPRHATCPHGFWLDRGVRASGDFECVTLTPEQWQLGARGGWVDASGGPTMRILGHVFCATGERALTSDGTSVFCDAIGGLL